MVLAPHDMRDAGLDVVDDGGEGVEIGAVFADQDRIGEAGRVDALRPAHEVFPLDALAREFETPVRLAAFCLEFRLLLVR